MGTTPGLTPTTTTSGGATPSRAAQKNLDRAIDEQQLRNAWPVLVLRVVLTATGSVLFLLMRADDPAIEISRHGTWAYFAIALALIIAVRLQPKLLKPSLYGVAFVDIPLLTYLQYNQLAKLPEPLMNAPANAAMMIGLIVLSALSLSRLVIVVTSLVSFASVVLVGSSSGMIPLPLSLVLIVIPGVAFSCSLMVTRIRDVVRESRQRDLLGKYVLGNRLGAGGMAEVFEATYCPEGGFERRVAVKKILPAFLANADAVSLFRREARLGAGLSHPNLVNVLDFGSTETGGYFLVMEYVDGCSLAEVLRHLKATGTPLSTHATTWIAWSLAEALDHLHEHLSPAGVPQRLVHRDVNPPNVLLSRNADVKLSDFGIARDVDAAALTEDGLMRGKLAYAAPEQFLGQPPDRRLDLFALGVTLTECLLLQRPFSGTDAIALQKAISEGRRDPWPPALVTNAEPLLRLIDALLEPDPERRTPSARALSRALSALPLERFDGRKGREELTRLVGEANASKHLRTPVVLKPAGASDETDQVSVRPR